MAKAAPKKKTGKRVNIKLKRTVRKALAAVLMMTAIIIAAVPVPDVAADDPSAASSLPSAWAYPAAVSDATFDKPMNLTHTTQPLESAYTIRQGSDGRWQLDWQFHFFMDTYNGGQYGVISDYNKTYFSPTVDLKVNATSEYFKKTKDEYDQFYTDHNADSKKMDTPLATDAKFFEKYFNELYLKFIADYNKYEADFAAYEVAHAAWVTAGRVGTEPQPPTNKPSPLEKTVGDLGGNYDDPKLEYYCDVEPNLAGKGYKMQEVLDGTAQTVSGGNADSKKCFIPKGPLGEETDDNGFRELNTARILAIGDEAFKDTQNVDILNLASEIKFIGDEAFMNTFVKSVTFTNVESVGNRAFKASDQLTVVDLKPGIVNIGAEAFYGTGIKSVDLPSTVKLIGTGAFADCKALQTVDLSKLGTRGFKISDYAFYDDINLNSVTFGEAATQNITGIGKAAFAVSTGAGGGMTEFSFPSQIATVADFGDYAIAGRNNLKKVIMPYEFGHLSEVVVPKGTFANCNNLDSVEFPDNGIGSCGQAEYDVALFKDVQNPKFYVRGPELDSMREKALPRKSTWVAKTGVVIGLDDSGKNIYNSIPYVYNKGGVDYYEISNGTYLQQINDKGELTSTEFLPGVTPGPIKELVIPSNVGGKKVISIADGCFSEDVKKNIQTLKIEDDSITTIGDNVFSNCPEMKKATIGNSVNAIGANAFLNCPELIEVFFHSPSGGHEGFTIGADAFKTGSQELTFKGDLVKGYAPFDWATAPENVISTTTSKRVCFKSNAPSNLTVIRDNTTNKVTLVDYPFYENIDVDNAQYIHEQDLYFTNKYPTTVSDPNMPVYTPGSYSIIEKYENELNGTAGGHEWEIVNQTEREIIEATRNLVVPAGVQSVDVKGFLEDRKNTANLPYVESYRDINGNLRDNKFLGNGVSVSKAELFSVKKGIEAEEVHPGIFSGYFDEARSGNEPVQTAVKGNDRLVSVVLTDVEKLPDYAFDNCENLESVTLGNCTNVGTAPFTGCAKLVTVNGNDTYTCETGILYSTNSDGSKNIVECLATRGNLISPGSIATESDPLLSQVTSISKGAFENCDDLVRVDLSAATGLKIIPENCFHNSDGLTNITLPKSVNQIDKNAFTGLTKTPLITIPGKELSIVDDAFDHMPEARGGTIRTYKNTAADRYARKWKIDVTYIDEEYRVTFLDYDNITELKVQDVKAGEDATPPKDPTRVGYKFTGWNPSYENITRDMTIVAQYDPTGTGCKVWFKNWDNTDIIPVQLVEKGQNAVPPTTSPTRAGYTFGGWKPSYVNITEDTVIMAQWNSNGGNPEDPNGGGNGNGNGNNNNNNNNNNDNTKTYNVKVNGGSGSGSYKPGSIVSISAFAVSDGRVFYRWTTSSNGVGFTGVETATTTFTMPNNDVNITATYGGPRTASSNNSVTDKKPTISGNTNTGGGGSSSGGNKGNGGSTNTGNPGGTVISITKPGFSNTNVASALVNGSTDNYIIKVIEDSTAQAAIEAALLADAQTLENIKYFPMDISMYDSTGTTKVTNIEGITVDITLPIPDDLVQYAGNNKVAAVANGSLEKLPAKFKSIDGVPCVTFTATHFSPYAIYVDTANLTEGTTDTSPTTGDGIHPKWFLVLGLACISGILFVKRDRTVNKVKTA